jgi:hypothetical protein
MTIAVFDVFVPLALAERGITGVALTQVAVLVGFAAYSLSTRLSLRRAIKLASWLLAGAGAIALFVDAAAGAWAIAIAAIARVAAAAGLRVGAGSAVAVVGNDGRALATVNTADQVGLLGGNVLFGSVWTALAPAGRYEVVVLGALFRDRRTGRRRTALARES